MDRRLILQTRLEEIPRVKKVYYQPPANLKMVFPAIRYELDRYWTLNANDKTYRKTNRYNVIEIDRDPDSPIPDLIQKSFQLCTLDRVYIIDNLYHRSFTIYF